MQKLLLINNANKTQTDMKELYFLCCLRWDASQHKEIITARSKGYATVAALMQAATPWIMQNLGKKFFVQKYTV